MCASSTITKGVWIFNKFAKENLIFPFSAPSSILSKLKVVLFVMPAKWVSKFSLCAYNFLPSLFSTLKDWIVETKIQALLFKSWGLTFTKSAISKIATFPPKADSKTFLLGWLGFFNVSTVCSLIIVDGVNHKTTGKSCSK